MLASKGFLIITAHSAEQAIALLETIRPIAVITDLMMPDMSGVDFIRYIRSSTEYAAIPIVAVSAMGAGHLEEAKQAGASMVLSKPVDLTLLADTLWELERPRIGLDDHDDSNSRSPITMSLNV